MLGARGMPVIDWGNESVTPPRLCFNEARSCGNVAERLANAFDCLIQAEIEVDEGGAGPDPGLQFFPGN